MAELSTVARPYTKAAFASAIEQKSLDQWSEMLAVAAQAASDEQVAALLGNPALSAEQKAGLVLDVCADKLNEQGQNFIKLLAENKRLPVLPEISVLFDRFKAEQQKSVDVEVTSAYKLTKEQQTNLAQALGAKLDREVNITSSQDKSLIGGLIVRTDDLVIDGSVRGKLQKLAEALGS
ncbi:F0F1 ATP synthase subunit delta [Motiliproteus coralliicola]|uniref:ATP synthase subunit delta n=1 Tax=Motiliproteus coralliicola TaxID=2283196 RepID=A0A369WDX9_9GAMM|nr:F0F1 ATP synthase subunit delta [Motiliproteus coralliicola]RDE18826.1 F0F1 ATP synthase subunit delta [Motiliproteus coralliicola]